jgi:MIP family channel proteins
LIADWKRRATAEAIGTFGLTFVIGGALCADRYSGGELGLLGVAIASGAALAAMAYATQPVSGGHLNPATTVGAMALHRVSPGLGFVYIGAQLAGAGLAGACLAGLCTPQIWEPVNLGTPTLSLEVVFATGVFVEALLTFLLVITALQVAENGEAAAMVYGLAIGLVLMCGTLVGGPLTGAAMNPARAFGPALASGVWTAHAVYWIGPIMGGLSAALASRWLQPAELS